MTAGWQRCPRESDGEHRWVRSDPPEWMDTSEWDDAAWASWEDDTSRTCYSCGLSDE